MTPEKRSRPAEILAHVDHRPWLMPTGPWVMRQSWVDFLFCHWPMPVAAIRPLVPKDLVLDTWDGTCWLGVLPFHMSGVTLRFFPDIPRFSDFPELNVRTYVRMGDKAGVFFLSLEAGNRLAVALARWWWKLPYFRAAMTWSRDGDTISYQSRRTHVDAPAAELDARYRPTGPVSLAGPGTFERWLSERYALYVADRRGRIYRGDVHHAPWPLQPAEIEIRTNTMARAHGLDLPDTAPHVMYASRADVVVWRLAAV